MITIKPLSCPSQEENWINKNKHTDPPPKKSVFKDSHNFKILPYKSSKSLKLQYLEEYKPSILKYFHNQKYFVKPCIHIFSAEYIVSKDKRGFGVHTHFSES